MTVAPAPCKVLVTGANGFIAIWVVRTLLERGYLVRGAVRSASKGKYLTEYFGKRGFGTDKLEIVIVEDITKPGAFDEAVKGVDAIEHTASPVVPEVKDPQGAFLYQKDALTIDLEHAADLIKPAVQGTVGILQSALDHGSGIRRIVITSSGAAILVRPTVPTLFSEEDWNTFSVEDVEKNGVNAHPESGYRASKTLAERAAWEFVEKNKSKISWDLVVINPPVVLGPGIQEITGGPANLNASIKWLYEVVVNSSSQSEKFLYSSSVWVDVRDMALAHILALQKEAAGGERIVVSAGPFIWQDLVDIANQLTPYPLPSHPPPKGIPGLDKTYLVHFKPNKQEKILGMPVSSLRTMEETVRDALTEFAARGWPEQITRQDYLEKLTPTSNTLPLTPFEYAAESLEDHAHPSVGVHDVNSPTLRAPLPDWKDSLNRAFTISYMIDMYIIQPDGDPFSGRVARLERQKRFMMVTVPSGDGIARGRRAISSLLLAMVEDVESIPGNATIRKRRSEIFRMAAAMRTSILRFTGLDNTKGAMSKGQINVEDGRKWSPFWLKMQAAAESLGNEIGAAGYNDLVELSGGSLEKMEEIQRNRLL
ncbi:hypothetical protein NP233_g2544 [Leucocoprinus birnbaumii]|uniref:NAD-dependent epimerase/dehydratase domain-containing protein n=1 Tax=Leucocoprinus birnbaumii TaxID=56174 RepID=A0AAD5VY64_9AGAR|nr:hypothetical protein NP233_g2544 [Leucocoprinus birnbaumii]